jgi:hypothetical protein
VHNLSTVEAWLPVPDFQGYEVSDWGRVRSFWYAARLRDKPRLLKLGRQGRHGCEYLYVNLWCGGKCHRRPIHRLVLEVFVGPCPAGHEACHFPDRDGTNNQLSNLRWDTKQANMQDQMTHGTQAIGSRNGCAKLTEADIPIIKQLWASGAKSQNALAREYGVSVRAISFARKGKLWKHA